ncbi:hypothetical protein FACS189430_08400 [Bacteroidia bacterium]|nr:hypothetical protein FACS189430_08400 [Bacteroidia bacterium]
MKTKNVLISLAVMSMMSVAVFAQNRTSTKEQLPGNKFTLLGSVNRLKSVADERIEIAPPSQAEIDELIADSDVLYMVAKVLPLNITPVNSGRVDRLGNGGKLWRTRIASAGSKSVVLLFDYFNLPAGAEMYVHCENTNTVFGPYTRESNPSGEDYSIGIIPDDEVTVEYYVPNGIELQEADFNISGFDYFFRSGERGELDATPMADTGYGASAACEVNANCAAGNDWRTQQKGVCKMALQLSNGIVYCTGSLVNNTSNNGTPYILSAQHCEGSSTVNYSQSIFYFHYESSACTNSAPTATVSFTGATKRAWGTVEGGSDFLLLQLNATPAAIKNANLVYNGWDRTDVQKNPAQLSYSGVSIHHPKGDIKKISTYAESLYIYTWGTTGNPASGAPDAHWSVRFSSGTTEGGSSGSPLFSGENKVITGTLTGGNALCTNGFSAYGRFDKHWQNAANGSGTNRELKHWLDPADTGDVFCSLYDPNAAVAVSSVAVAPAAVSVAQGGTQQFSATVAGSLSLSQAVYWTVAGGVLGTTVSTEGVLTVAADETAASLTVKATSKLDHTKSGTAKVAVTTVATATIPFVEDFEGATSEWVLANSIETNHWVVSTAAGAQPDGSSKSLYIANNNAATPTYAYTTTATSYVYAYRQIDFTNAGAYQIQFDWKANGEPNYDLLHCFLVPNSVNLTAGNANGMTDNNNNTPARWLDLTGGVLSGHNTWQSFNDVMNVTAAGTYKLVFFWKNDNLSGSQPPAVVDNISITQPAVSSVEVTPATVSVAQGGTQQFSATVAGSLSLSQAVYWTVAGGVSGTTVSTEGLLTVAADETAASLTVTATSKLDNTKSGTATVAVLTIVPATIPFAEDFEGATSEWALANGIETNHWVVSTAAGAQPDGSSKSLYIANNNAATPTYAYTTTATSYVYAYRQIDFTNAGAYQIQFDWKANGEPNYDLLHCFLVPNSVNLTAGNASGMTSSNNNTPAGWLDLTGGVLSEHNTWQSFNDVMNVTAAGTYKLVFFWKNDNLLGSQPPAAVDNISIRRLQTHTITLDAAGGTVTPATVNVVYGNPVGALPAPTRSGYNFGGWFTAQNAGTSYTATTLYNVANDITLFARWTAIIYDISYVLGRRASNHANNPATYTIETLPLILQNPTRSGYTFDGWAEGNTIAAICMAMSFPTCLSVSVLLKPTRHASLLPGWMYAITSLASKLS